VDETHRHYLRDLGHLIREAAEESARVAAGDAFEQGRRLAYYEVVSLMLSQAATFGLAAEDLAMAGLDPDRDLLGPLA
jgi:hypothetical protein